ncbi:glycosyl transferase family 90-domain-containing protein [Obelidium mucronatum]|nr:glycosyl transferase family 90-domain-containing protein [Obelidium mucronatum]
MQTLNRSQPGTLSLIRFSRGKFWTVASSVPAPYKTKLLDPIAHFLPGNKSFQFLLSLTDYPSLLPASTRDVVFKKSRDLLDLSPCLNQSFDQTERESHGFFLRPKYFLTTNKGAEGGVMSWSRPKGGCFKDILFPGLYHVGKVEKMASKVDVIPWEKKKRVLFFRGSPTGGRFVANDESTWKKFHRVRLLEWEKAYRRKHPNLVVDVRNRTELRRIEKMTSGIAVDIGFHTGIQGPKNLKTKLQKMYPLKSIISFEKTMEFKYLLVPDGYTWPARMQYYLASNSVVLYAGIFEDYYMWKLKPWVHYIPVKLDFSDLEEKLKWLAENDNTAKQINQNAKILAKSVNSLAAMQCFAGMALIEYSARFLDQ